MLRNSEFRTGHVVSDQSRCNSLPWPSFRHGHGSVTVVSDEIGAVATLGSTTGDSRVKYQPTPVVAVGFVVVVNIAWRSQWSHDMLGVHRPTTVAALLLATERRRARVAARSFAEVLYSLTCSEFAVSRTVASLLTTESSPCLVSFT